MDDKEIMAHIDELIQTEHALRSQLAAGELSGQEERERLRRVFERGLETPAGMVLPLQRGWGKNGPEWQTGLWMLRGQHLYLLPGDSPVGLRLPLPSLPWVAASEAPQFYPVDPMVNQSPLPNPPRNAWRAGFSPREASASLPQRD